MGEIDYSGLLARHSSPSRFGSMLDAVIARRDKLEELRMAADQKREGEQMIDARERERYRLLDEQAKATNARLTTEGKGKTAAEQRKLDMEERKAQAEAIGKAGEMAEAGRGGLVNPYLGRMGLDANGNPLPGSRPAPMADDPGPSPAPPLAAPLAPPVAHEPGPGGMPPKSVLAAQGVRNDVYAPDRYAPEGGPPPPPPRPPVPQEPIIDEGLSGELDDVGQANKPKPFDWNSLGPEAREARIRERLGGVLPPGQIELVARSAGLGLTKRGSEYSDVVNPQMNRDASAREGSLNRGNQRAMARERYGREDAKEAKGRVLTSDEVREREAAAQAVERGEGLADFVGKNPQAWKEYQAIMASQDNVKDINSAPVIGGLAGGFIREVSQVVPGMRTVRTSVDAAINDIKDPKLREAVTKIHTGVERKVTDTAKLSSKNPSDTELIAARAQLGLMSRNATEIRDALRGDASNTRKTLGALPGAGPSPGANPAMVSPEMQSLRAAVRGGDAQEMIAAARAARAAGVPDDAVDAVIRSAKEARGLTDQILGGSP